LSIENTPNLSNRDNNTKKEPEVPKLDIDAIGDISVNEKIPPQKKKLKLSDLGFFQKIIKAAFIKNKIPDDFKTVVTPENNTLEKELEKNNEKISNDNNLKIDELKEGLSSKAKKTKNKKTDSNKKDLQSETPNKNNFFSTLRKMITNVAIEENDKFEDKVYYGFVYPMLDIFDNRKFNMERLKSIDFLCEQKKFNFNFKTFKQLGKEEKKKFLADIAEIKQKFQDEKLERIKNLKKEGKNYKYIKLSSYSCNEISLVKETYFKKSDIYLVKQCEKNKWNFPPLKYYEKISNFLNYNQQEEIHSSGGNNNVIIETKSSNNLDESGSYKNKNSNDPERDPMITLKAIYATLIDNEFGKYSTKDNSDIIIKNGCWIDLDDYFDLFDNYIILYNPRFYRYQISIDNLPKNFNHDVYVPDDSKTVFYINTNIKFNLDKLDYLKNQNNKDNNYNESCLNSSINCFDEVNFNLENSNNIFDRENFFSVLICFMSNCQKLTEENKKNFNIDKTKKGNKLEKSKNIFIENYIKFDLLIKDPLGKYEVFAENITFKSFYDTKQINYLEKNKEYILILKGGMVPIGFSLNICSDCYIEGMSFEKYLETYQNYKCLKYNLKYKSIEAKKCFLLCKLSLKVKLF